MNTQSFPALQENNSHMLVLPPPQRQTIFSSTTTKVGEEIAEHKVCKHSTHPACRGQAAKEKRAESSSSPAPPGTGGQAHGHRAEGSRGGTLKRASASLGKPFLRSYHPSQEKKGEKMNRSFPTVASTSPLISKPGAKRGRGAQRRNGVSSLNTLSFSGAQP